jgi:diguanylate cyclase (GGDEF)-like protein
MGIRPPGLPEADANGAAAPFGGAGEAMHAVSHLLGSASAPGGPAAVAERLVSEARRFFRVTRTVLLSVAEHEGRVEVLAMDPEGNPPVELLALADLTPVATLATSRPRALRLAGAPATELARALGAGDVASTALLLPMQPRDAIGQVLVLLDEHERSFSPAELEVAGAFAAAAAASLAQLQLAHDRAAQTARQAALARAAKTLNESLDLNRVLVRICEESASILDGDNAAVYLGNGRDGLRTEAAYGQPPEVIGVRLGPGEGLAGKAVQTDEPMLTNDYQGMPDTPSSPYFDEIRSCLAVPMHWGGELRGALAIGYTRPYLVTREHLSLLEAFAELAAVACGNASAHAGLAMEARTDGLTGCLNHATLHDTLRRELERCSRTGHSLSLALIDLDDFKQVNERHGHLAGDEALRRVGHALRQGIRSYDVVARYGGDEFAMVAVDAAENEAADIASRAIERVASAMADFDADRSGAGWATAGVAELDPQEDATSLIERADRALLYGKQQGSRGVALRASAVPTTFHPAGSGRTESRPQAVSGAGRPRDPGREQTKNLRKRTRQLGLANALGTRLAAMTDPDAIVEAVVEELNSALGYFLCAVVRSRDDGYVESAASRGLALASGGEKGWSQPAGAGLIGRCLRERRPVVAGDVLTDQDYRSTPETATVRSELVVPLWVGEELWGVLDVQETRAGAFDEDDVRLIQTVADQVGSALRGALLYQRLERAYVGTAEALAAALEAKDSYTANHSRTVVEMAHAVGLRLDLDEPALRTLRFGAIFHDIGKIAVPEEILNKRGSLTEEEWEVTKRHPVAGERILASVEFLADVRPLVRHEHERWDGSGYPDGLAGEEIPLGARIILACDAYDAMTSDRPYRTAMSAEQAHEELRRGAATQFDPRVVVALLDLLAEPGERDLQDALSDSR